MSFITAKFHKTLLSGFRRCADKKNRTDRLTDRLMDGSKTLYPQSKTQSKINIHAFTNSF